jgi:hypothetical protein
MIVVSIQTAKYCQENNLPFPSQKDFSSIGTFVRRTFGFKWVRTSGFQGPIEGTGLMRIKEGATAVVVNFYPDNFSDEMNAVIDRFYKEKKARMDADEIRKKQAAESAAKPKRPRISSNKPLYSRR